MANLGFEMTYKAQDGTLVPLHPRTTLEQVVGLNIGEIYGPYIFTLAASGWQGNKQTVTVSDITENDRPKCGKILSGSEEEIIAQNEAYNLLDSRYGIEAKNGQVVFSCKEESPTIDIQVQIVWSR